MPSLIHEAPLVVLREEPALVPALLREALGLALPEFGAAEVADADFNQVRPVERRADLVVHLKGVPPDERPVMGIVIEIQRARDDDKRYSWPLYVAALHARLRCQTCLVVIALDEVVARWAAHPITTLQLGAPFAPHVIGPLQMPRFARDDARRSPWMAVLSGLVHGNQPDGEESVRAAAVALHLLPEGVVTACYDLLSAALAEGPRRILEEAMHFEKYEYRSEFARRHRSEGRSEGQNEGRSEGRVEEARAFVLALAERYGAVSEQLRARVVACGVAEQLRALGVELAGADDAASVARVLAALPAVVA